MVLSKHLSAVFFLYFLSFSLFCEDASYWKRIITEAFRNDPEVAQLKKDYTSQMIYKKQNDYLWFPNLQFDINQTLEESRGDYLYVQNQYTSENNMWLTSPNVNLSINQKLSGNGSLNLSAGYGFNYLIDRNAFLQEPRLQLTLNQYLGYGAFGISGNPERKLLDIQMEYSHLNFSRGLITRLQDIFTLLRNLDQLCADEKYYASMVTQYDMEMQTAAEKHDKGLQSNLETYYANHQFLNAKNQLEQIRKQKTDCCNQIELIIPDFDIKELETNYKYLEDITSNVFFTEKVLNIGENYESRCYLNIMAQQSLNYRINEINYEPQLYISSSIYPDSNLYIYYADWFKSLRNLTEPPSPVNFVTSIGFKINFEIPKAKKLRKELYRLERNATLKEYQNSRSRQEKEFSLLRDQLDDLEEYYSSLAEEIELETEFRKNRRMLFDQKLLTQNEYYESETTYFLLYKDYVSTFWEIITDRLRMIGLNSDDDEILKIFLGEDYEDIL